MTSKSGYAWFHLLAMAVLAFNALGFTPARAAPLNARCSSPITVLNGNDSGAGSLRQAIIDVCPAGTITFAADYSISLLTGKLAIAKSLTIDGGSHTIVVDGNFSSSVFAISSGTVTLNKLTIQRGSAVGSSGGINNAGNLTVTNSILTNNSDGGGVRPGIGIYNSGSLIVLNSTFSGNSANFGGAIYNSGSLTVSNSTFSGNSATGIFIVSYNFGGAIYNTGTGAIANSTFSNNSVTVGSSGYGGGGAIYTSNTLSISNSTFSNNTANDANGPDYGGAIYNYSSNLTIWNSTFSGNAANSGGGIFATQGSTSYLINSTFSGNSSDSNGDSIYNNGIMKLANSLLTDSYQSNCLGSITDLGYNLDSGNACGFSAPNHSLINTDPKLGTLADNGGPTRTIPLLAGSPAINAGNDTVCNNAASVNNLDQRGIARPQGSHCDIGAFEYLPANVNVTIAGAPKGNYNVPTQSATRQSYASVNNGPVTVTNTNTLPLVASERIAYSPDGGSTWTSYAELMGLPSSKLTDTYIFPWYNSINLSSQVSFADVGAVNTTVTVTIGGAPEGSYPLIPGQSLRIKYPNLNTGPVKVQSSGGVPIVASERIAFTPDAGVTYTNYYELMGLPYSSLSDTYIFPWYNSIKYSSQVSFANVGASSTTVTVTISSTVVGTYLLAPNESKRIKYLNWSSGPVKVQSSGGIPIIASERVSYTPDGGVTYPSFSELIGLPVGQLSDAAYFPGYNDVNHHMTISMANMGSASTTVTVAIGGVAQGTYTLTANHSMQIYYHGLNSGPVQVNSNNGMPIVASEYVDYTPDAGVTYTSFAEMMGLPAGQLSTSYVFPWYNSLNLNTEVRFGAP